MRCIHRIHCSCDNLHSCNQVFRILHTVCKVCNSTVEVDAPCMTVGLFYNVIGVVPFCHSCVCKPILRPESGRNSAYPFFIERVIGEIHLFLFIFFPYVSRHLYFCTDLQKVRFDITSIVQRFVHIPSKYKRFCRATLSKSDLALTCTPGRPRTCSQISFTMPLKLLYVMM